MSTIKPASGEKIKSAKKAHVKCTDAVSPDTDGASVNNNAIEEAESFPIVGIGASAGGLAAFEAFFSGMPSDTDPDMAFVLVQHLAPDHKSILTELIQRSTRMKVFEVTDGITVQPNCTYIIAPGYDMAFLNGALHLLEPSAPRGQRLTIDFFFRSLAQDQHERAIGIILSGTGSDGTMGIRAIKDEGGMVMVQNPASAEYDGMPHSALGTGIVDYELPPAEMPAQLIAYVTHAFGNPPCTASGIEMNVENALKKIFILLRGKTGHDFSQYKPSTIKRRIERRMAIHQIETMDEYIMFLRQTPDETESLFRDLLIGVTSFFRDPDVFKALEEQAIPKIFAGKSENTDIRIWSAGCSTGEEAYSIAILLYEGMELLKQSFRVQIFASDIDSRAITIARAGLYPASLMDSISPERLARFFTSESDGDVYRINKSIRDMMVFSEHNIIKDPPFSKLDLISCRNLMIYMSGDLQKKIIPLFHYALKPNGILMLGTSETTGDNDSFFIVLDRKMKIYQRKNDFHGSLHTAIKQFVPPQIKHEKTIKTSPGRKGLPLKLPLRELTEQTLLKQIAPAGALVNNNGDILYFHGHTGLYLEPAPGEAGINNIFKMTKGELKRELTTALHKSTSSGEIVRRSGIHIITNGHSIAVNLMVCPAPETQDVTDKPSLYLVILEEAPDTAISTALPPKGNASTDADIRIVALKKALQDKEEYLESANEELETSNEELTSANEEMQSVNEELQSTNEELQTSKEELQSVNEELSTVNAELQTKVSDLSRTSNDMNNLLAGTGIGTVFVDTALRILRFTPAVTRIINLIQSDVGRPVNHIAANMVGYNELVADARTVLNSLISKQVEVQTIEGKWYTMRIQPYRTLENVIEGIVITFVDITEIKKAQEALAVSEIRYRRLFETAKDGILIVDAETGKILNVNPYLIEMLGYSKEQLIEKNIWDIGLFKDIVPNKENFLELQKKEYMRYENMPLETADGRTIDVEFVSNVYLILDKKVIQCNIRNITDRKFIESALTQRETLLNTIQRLNHIGGWEYDAVKKSTYWTDEMYRLHDLEPGKPVPGTPEHTALSMECYLPEDRTVIQAAYQNCIDKGEPYDLDFHFTTSKGRQLWIRTVAEPVLENGKVARVTGFIMDISDHRSKNSSAQTAAELKT